MEPKDVVQRYFDLMDAAIGRRDPEAIAERAGLVSSDIVYQNVPLRVIRGVAEHNEWKRGFAECERMTGTVLHLAQDGEYVLMERDESWTIRGVTVGGTIMGIMRVVGGLIVEWTDYQARFAEWRASGQMSDDFWKRWEEAPPLHHISRRTS